MALVIWQEDEKEKKRTKPAYYTKTHKDQADGVVTTQCDDYTHTHRHTERERETERIEERKEEEEDSEPDWSDD